jgi:hypothetical protein
METIMKSAEKNIIRNKRSTEVDRLVYNFVVVVVTIEFGNKIRSPTGMHGTSKSKLEVAEQRVGWIDYLTVLSVAKHNLVSITKAHCGSIITDYAENIFALPGKG